LGRAIAKPNKVLKTIGQVQKMLNFSSFSDAEHFLNQSQIYLDSSQEDLSEGNKNQPLAAAFKELQQICIEEDYFLEIPFRQDRPKFNG
jgi:hypothetical protein